MPEPEAARRRPTQLYDLKAPYFEVWPVSIREINAEGPRPLFDSAGQPCNVEEAALGLLRDRGLVGIFSANEAWWQLAFILFWEQVYAQIEEGFDPEFGDPPTDQQDIPADLFSMLFYSRRCEAIDRRAHELERDTLIELVREGVRTHRDSQCRILRGMTSASEEAMYFLAERLPSAVVVRICKRLLEDFTENRKGLPDLVALNEEGAHFIEVKSQNDRLSLHQIEWFRFLSANTGGRAVVLAVNHSEAQLERLSALTMYPDAPIRIRFRRTSSRYFTDALKIAGTAKSHTVTTDEAGKQVHDVEVSRLALKELRALLEVVALWKGTQLWISGVAVAPSDWRGVLDCFAKKVSSGSGLSWCRIVHHTNQKATFCCNEVRLANSAGERMPWHSFGHLNRETGVFEFDRKRIRQEVAPKIESASLCPVFDRRAANAALEAIPNTVSPGIDPGWGFVEEEGVIWMRHGDGWISDHGTTGFPGAASMAGVASHTSRDVADALRFGNALRRDGIVIYRGAESRQLDDVPEATSVAPPASKSTGRGCLICLVLGITGAMVAFAVIVL